MSDSYLLEPKDKHKHPMTPYQWFTVLLKITFFVCAFFLVIFTVLANMGGKSETLHEGVRSFISRLAGNRPVELGKLNYMEFFPNVRLDIEDVRVYAKKDDDVPLLSLDHLRLGMPFFDVATQAPRVSEIYVEGLEAIKGVFMPHDFSLDQIFIDHNPRSLEAFLRAKGKVGVHDWRLDIALSTEKSLGGKNLYILAPQSHFSFDMADIHMQGLYDHSTAGFFKVVDLEIRSSETSMAGEITVSTLGNRLVKLTGRLDIADGRSVILPDFVIDTAHKDGAPVQISGELRAETIDLKDIIGSQSISGIVARLRSLMGYEGGAQTLSSFLGARNLDVHVYLRDVTAGEKAYELLSFDLLQQAGRLRMGSVTGKDDRIFVPPFMVMREDGDLVAIMQDGALEPNLAGSWIKNMPDISQTTCAIGSFDDETGLFTMAFDRAIKPINLTKDAYNFVQGSLQKSGQDSPCSAYIAPKIAPKEED